MPEHPATDNRGQIHLLRETATVLLVGQEVDRQWQPTAGQYRDQTVLTQRTDETVERHGRDMMNHRAQLQTEAAMRGQQGITGNIRTHLTIAQDEVRQDREHRATRGALDTPDGEPTQPDTGIMGVAGGETPPPAGRPLLGVENAGGEGRGNRKSTKPCLSQEPDKKP